ncbi:hypothetical protein [Streptomyces sp. SID14515]|nr:hypothetical protein [Streptomyces sp. SID14515]
MSRYLTPEDAALAGASVLDGPQWDVWREADPIEDDEEATYA